MTSQVQTGSETLAHTIRRPDEVKDFIHGLHFLWLEITPKCNLECRHCYVEASPSRKISNVVDWSQVLIDARNLGCRSVQFIGGEPLTHPRLLEFVSEADKLGYEFIEVYSNLTLANDRILRKFAECRVNLATSFYSTKPDVHDMITQRQGSFFLTRDVITRVLEFKIPLRVGLIDFGQGEKEMDDATDLLLGLGLSRERIRIDHVRPVGRGAKMVESDCSNETLCGACWQGKLAVTSDGSVYPCVFARHVTVGTVNGGKIQTIMHSMELRNFRKSSFDSRRSMGDAWTDCGPDYRPPQCSPA